MEMYCLVAVMLLLLCGVTRSKPYDGPFGLKKGLTLAKLKKFDPNIEKIKEGVYQMRVVPTPHKSFVSYAVVVSPKTGLCKISCASKEIFCNSYGTQLKAEHESIRDALERRYGSYDEMDCLFSGSIWNQPEDFMKSLLLEERTLSSFWDLEAEVSSALSSFLDTWEYPPTNNGILNIYMETQANDIASAFIILNYEFDNFTEFAEQQKEKEDSAF
ncbi:MAG: hypothetical protein Q8M98_11750 [Candidatus Cloacimonadaceae bacterium]|nr:hypothetical protein [Candidatus Cloacimonadaceae bacterium]